ncbi:MAG: hypothetical protein AAF494_10820 [Pseudomonadota bacterium]
MSNDIRSRISSISSVGRVQAGGTGTQTSATVSAIATSVAEQIADSLELTGNSQDKQRRGRNAVLPSDLYAVREQAEALAQALQADPSEAAELNRALDRFAESCATLIAAQPAAFSVERVRAVVADKLGGDGLDTAQAACVAIERASRAIEQSSW